MTRAEIAEIDTATLRSKYAVKKTKAGLGAREGGMGDRKLLLQTKWRNKGTAKLWQHEPKQRPKRATGTRRSTGCIGNSTEGEAVP